MEIFLVKYEEQNSNNIKFIPSVAMKINRCMSLVSAYVGILETDHWINGYIGLNNNQKTVW